MSLITYLTRIHFADRVLEDALPEEVARLAITRPLVISDPVPPGSDRLERLADALPVGVHPEHLTPGAEDCAEAGAAMRDAAGCDGIIGLGGPAALDLARRLGGRARRVIAIPTGTHSVGLGPLGPAYARPGVRHQRVPDSILCDPTLATDNDPAETAIGGMDALVHCLESFLSPAFNPPADGIALDGLRRAWCHLEAALDDGQDLAARRELLAAALDAGLAAEKGYGGLEAAGHGLGAASGACHGRLHGALLPEIMRFNGPAVAARAPAIRSALGLPAEADFAGALALLAERIGLPMRLSEAGIAATEIAAAARRAAADPANRTNPRHATARDYEAIMRAVL